MLRPELAAAAVLLILQLALHSILGSFQPLVSIVGINELLVRST